MENCLKIYPRHGFLNTEYKVHSEKEDSFTILFNGQKMFEGIVKAGETKVLPKLHVAGEYIVISNRSNDRQKICVEDSLETGEIIAHSKEHKTLYVLDKCKKYISIVRTENFSIETEYHNINSERQDFYNIDNENGLLYVVEGKYINVIDIDSKFVRKFEMSDNVIGITKTGYLISYKRPQYEYIDLKTNALGKNAFYYNPLITKFEVYGLAIANPVWSNCVDNSKTKEEYLKLSEEFARECREKIAKGDNSKSFSKDISFDHISQAVSFYPTKKGVYVIECLERMYENQITYDKHTKEVSYPFYGYQERLVWISNNGYEVCYSSGGDWSPRLEELVIKNEYASFKANSSLYLILKNGEIIRTSHEKPHEI